MKYIICVLWKALFAFGLMGSIASCYSIKTGHKQTLCKIHPPSGRMEHLVDSILWQAGLDRNFKLAASNVKGVLATTIQGERYVLYSKEFLKGIQQPSTHLAYYALFAHQVAHHALNHPLNEQDANKLIAMEAAADSFSGKVLRRLGVKKFETIRDAQLKWPSHLNGIGFLGHEAQIQKGWAYEDRSRKFKDRFREKDSGDTVKNGDLDNDGILDMFDKCPSLYGASIAQGCPDEDGDGISDFEDHCPKEKGPASSAGCPNGFPVPQFPWPPPQCFQRSNLANHLGWKYKTYQQVEEKISYTLNLSGYYQRSYFQVPGGFAMVTQLEQFDDEGNIKEHCRWVDYPVQDFDGVWDYLTSLVMPNPGHFRIFVFVVTDRPYTQSEQKVSKEEATSWISKGLNRLPTDMGKTSISPEHYLDVLVYEFEAPQSTRKCTQKCPCLLDSQTHLAKSRLYNLGF